MCCSLVPEMCGLISYDDSLVQALLSSKKGYLTTLVRVLQLKALDEFAVAAACDVIQNAMYEYRPAQVCTN
jgi:hypothetical protein